MSTNLIAFIVGAVLAGLGSWTFQDTRRAAEVSEIRLAQATAEADAREKALAEERAITTRYEGALNAARTREAALRRDVDSARAESDRLRDQNADAARRLASAPAGAVLEYALAVNQLFDQCQREYQGLAAKADGHASDVLTLIEAWPKLPSNK
ncbi:hypothetical protein PSQ40_05055 [Curvibacter sp. HBC61]|uniref:DNA recombination protein RmuC n=1 Tax=Curvibacter cyanobacteriorum TaxID=3026422 RepID=A0ABT5MVK3_9BURK|nr:hypothetical protein [Curvibacter sp. HBC61]MDD0837935.1 hypothetical protein [Curvibacter sp. HBC61]